MKRFWKLFLVTVSALTCLAFGVVAAACKKDDADDGLVSYHIDVYLQNISGTAYAANAEFSVDGRGEVGSQVEVPSIDHFTAVDHPDATPEDARVLTEGENTFAFYYDRDRYAVQYDANEPAGRASGSVDGQTIAYQGSFRAAQNAFTLAGYRFAGWSTTQDGDVEYSPDERVTVAGPLTLYAVWDRGYTDRFGGDDLIFFPRLQEDTAILLRGNHEFEGTRTGNTFTFDRKAGALQGAVFGNTFSYAREDVQGTYYLYDCMNHPDFYGGAEADDPSRFDKSVTLVVDEYLNATYTSRAGAVEGEIVYSPEGDYLFTGENTSFHFSFSGPDGDGFSIRGDEANVYVQAMVIGGSVYVMGDVVILDGYGNAVLYMSSGIYNLGYDGFYAITNTISEGGQTMYRVTVDVQDPIGALGGGEGEWHRNVLYTIPAMIQNDLGVAYGYVEADVYNGEYHGTGEQEGETLTLDGIGTFSDSAVYTKKDGTTVKGKYTSTVDMKTGLVVTITSGSTTTVLKADPYAGTFVSYDSSKAEKYWEVYRATEQLDFPIIYLYYETAVTGGKKAEIWMSDDEGASGSVAATGYYTEETTGGMTFYTFHRTNVVGDFDGSSVPESCVFFLSSVYSQEDNRPRRVYCLREYNGEKRYVTYTAADGVVIERSLETTLQGVGSLLKSKNGTYTEGSATLTRSNWFDVETLEFLYGTETGAVSLLYKVQNTDDGYAIEPSSGAEVALYYYLFLEESQSGLYVQDLVLDGSLLGMEDSGDLTGMAKFNDDYGDGEWQNGTYKRVGYTDYGSDDVYELTVGGVVKFRFVLYMIGSDTVYFRYQEDLHGSFTVDNVDNARLELDGYYYGNYWVGDVAYIGTFSYNPVEELVYFTANTGEDFYFRLKGEKATVLDSAFGYYMLIDGNYEQINNAEVFFDGLGNVTVEFAGGGQSRTGTYRPYLPDSDEYIVVCSFGTGMEMPKDGWHVRLLYGVYAQGCIVFDPEMTGTFVNDNWDVLYLDGFGTGSLYAADGSMGGAGDYTVMDEDRGLLTFAVDDTTDVAIRFNKDNHTFEIMDFSSISYLYLSDAFDYIAFLPNGVLRVGSSTGMYFLGEDVFYGFLYSYETGAYSSFELPVPGGKNYTFRNTAYTLYEGSTVELHGKVNFYDENDDPIAEQGSKDATMTVRPNVGANYNMPVTISVDDESYSFVLNLYTEGSLNPRLTYDGVNYQVSFTLGSTDQFSIHAGYYKVEMDDYYSNYREEEGGQRGGKIVKETIGFGPIVLNAPTYSGYFFYHNNEHPASVATPITFSGVSEDDILKVGYRVGGLGDCLEIVFTNETEGGDGKTYAIDFYETYAEERGPCIVLQGFYEYKELETADYKVGVKFLVASTTQNSPGFGDKSAIGKPYSVTLWKKTDSNRLIVSYDTGISLNKDAVWLSEIKMVEGEDGEKKPSTVTRNGADYPDPGKGYYVEFEGVEEGVTSVTVHEYNIGQVATGAYLVNFFTDDEGKVQQVVGVAYSDGAGYYWIENTHDLEYHSDTDTWTFRGTPGAASTEKTYTLKFTTDGGKTNVTVDAV